MLNLCVLHPPGHVTLASANIIIIIYYCYFYLLPVYVQSVPPMVDIECEMAEAMADKG